MNHSRFTTTSGDRKVPLSAFLCLLFLSSFIGALIIPFMPFYLVDRLGSEPLTMGIYESLSIGLTIVANFFLARRIRSGKPFFPMIFFAILGYLAASLALSFYDSIALTIVLGSIGFGIGGSAVATTYSLGNSLYADAGASREKLNAYMRATTSAAWMIGPATAFWVLYAYDAAFVFRICACASIVWLVLQFLLVPTGFASKEAATEEAYWTKGIGFALMLGMAFILLFSLAHALVVEALPLYLVEEVGLPDYAPGITFSLNTIVEILVILSIPFFLARFGTKSLLITASILSIVVIHFLASVRSMETLVIGAALEGVYYGMFACLSISYLQRLAPKDLPLATACYWNALMLGILLAGPVAGLLAQEASFHAVLNLGTFVAALATLLLVLSPKPKKEL